MLLVVRCSERTSNNGFSRGAHVLRFDFTHYQPLQPSEIGEIEDLVNRYILANERSART